MGHGCALPERDLGSNGSSWAGGGGGWGLTRSPGTWGRRRHCTHPELVTVSQTQPTERCRNPCLAVGSPSRRASRMAVVWGKTPNGISPELGTDPPVLRGCQGTSVPLSPGSGTDPGCIQTPSRATSMPSRSCDWYLHKARRRFLLP